MNSELRRSVSSAAKGIGIVVSVRKEDLSHRQIPDLVQSLRRISELGALVVLAQEGDVSAMIQEYQGLKRNGKEAFEIELKPAGIGSNIDTTLVATIIKDGAIPFVTSVDTSGGVNGNKLPQISKIVETLGFETIAFVTAENVSTIGKIPIAGTDKFLDTQSPIIGYCRASTLNAYLRHSMIPETAAVIPSVKAAVAFVSNGGAYAFIATPGELFFNITAPGKHGIVVVKN